MLTPTLHLFEQGAAEAAPLRYLLYGRVSTPRQAAQGYSRDAQEKLGRDYVDERDGVFVDAILVQEKRADWEPKGLMEALRRAEAGEYDVLLVQDMSRLSGSTGKRAWVERQLAKHRVRVEYITQQFSDDPSGKLHATIMEAIAEYELANTEMRVRFGKLQKIYDGKPLGGGRKPPYGRKRRREKKDDDTLGATIWFDTNDDEADVIRELVRVDMLRGGFEAAAQRLNREHVPTPNGTAAWSHGMVRAILIDPQIYGNYLYGKTKVHHVGGKRKIEHVDYADCPSVQLEPIVSKSEYDKMWAAIRARKHRSGPRTRRDYQFTLQGLLHCAHCERPLAIGSSARGTKHVNRYYRCNRSLTSKVRDFGYRQCALSAIPAQELEDIAWSVLRQALSKDNIGELLVDACEANRAAARAAEQEALLARLLRQDKEAHADALLRASEARSRDDDIDVEAYDAIAAKLKARIQQHQNDLTNLQAREPVGMTNERALAIMSQLERYPARLEATTLDERRGLLQDAEFRATLALDDAGNIEIRGRRFRFEPTAAIPLDEPGVVRAQYVQTYCLRITTHAGDVELKLAA